MRHGPAAPAPGASVGRRACLCTVSEHAADRSAPPMRLTCATTQRKAEQRAVSRVSVTLVRMPDLYGARFGTVPRVVVFAAAFGVRLRALFSALPEGGRRSSAAGLEMGRSRRRAVGRRHGDGRRVRGFEVGPGIVHVPRGASRAPSHPRIVRPCQGGHDTSARRRFTARDSSTTRHSSLRSNTGSTATVTHSPVPHALQAQHRTESLEPSEAALGKGSSRQTADTPGWFLTFGSGRASLGTLAVRVALPSGLLLPSGISLPHRVRIRYGTTHAPARPVQSGAPSGQRRAACQGAPCTRG